MADTELVTIPSLSIAFEPERARLLDALTPDLSAAQIVSETRRSLDRTGAIFTKDIKDPQLQKAGLWLIEMVKAGAGVLDRGTEADVIWQEVAKPKARKWAGRGLFYGAAAALGFAGYVQTSGLVMLTAGVLAALRFFDPKDWDLWVSKLPFIKRPLALEDQSGRRIKAEARITADAAGFVDSLSEALKTADHILRRLSEPQGETHWRDDPQLMHLVHGLLEARAAKDGQFALKLIDSELESVLAAAGIEIIDYSTKTAAMFDILPMLTLEDDGSDIPSKTGVHQAAPALIVEGQLIRRGTVWKASP